MTHYKNALVKFNGGRGALLCSNCDKVIAKGLDHEDIEHKCDECVWQEIINYLTGSSSSLDNALYMFEAEELDSHDPFLVMLDEQIFLCDTCGWWCLAEEQNMSDELQCNDCCDHALDEEE
jgi:hypothetical protein